MPQNRKNTGNIADEMHIVLCCQPCAQQFADALGQQHGNNALCQIAHQRQRGTALAEAAERVGQTGVMAAELPNILMLQQPHHQNGTVETAQQIGQHRRNEYCKNQHDILSRYFSSLARSRTTNRTGVPVSPKVERIWFSIYR